MRKLLSFVVSFVLLVGVVPAKAQGYWNGGYRPSSWDGWRYFLQGDEVHMLQADQVDFIARTINIGRRAQMRRVTDDLAGYGQYVGLNARNGFYPLYQCSRRERLEKGLGRGLLTGAAVYFGGKLVGLSTGESATAAAMVGGGYAFLKDADCAPVQNNKVKIIGLGQDNSTMVVQPPPGQMQGLPAQAGRENGWNDILRDQANAPGNPWFGSQRSCLEQGMFTLKNDSSEVIRVYQDGQPFKVLKPRQSECGDPFASYDAEIISAVTDNYTAMAGVAKAKPQGRNGGVWVWR